MQYIIKIVLSALVILAVSEVSKRSPAVGGIFAALPLTSILAIIWLYVDTSDVQKIANLSQSIFWAVLPSLLFFIVLPLALRYGMKFWPALLLSSTVMVVAYWGYVFIMRIMGVNI